MLRGLDLLDKLNELGVEASLNGGSFQPLATLDDLMALRRKAGIDALPEPYLSATRARLLRNIGDFAASPEQFADCHTFFDGILAEGSSAETFKMTLVLRRRGPASG